MQTDYIVTEDKSNLTIRLNRTTLTFFELPVFMEVIEAQMEKKPTTLFIDFQATQHLDSSAIGFLIKLGRRLNDSNAGLILLNLHGMIREVMESLKEDAFKLQDN